MQGIQRLRFASKIAIQAKTITRLATPCLSFVHPSYSMFSTQSAVAQHYNPIINLNGVKYDLRDLNSTDLNTFAEVSPSQQEFVNIYEASKKLLEKNRIPLPQTDSFTSLMKIFESAGDKERKIALMQNALDHPTICSDKTVQQTMLMACEEGIEVVREALKIFSENNKIIREDAANEILNLVESKGNNEDYEMIYDLYLHHKILLETHELMQFIKYFTEQKNGLQLRILAKYFHKHEYTKVHILLAKGFMEIGDYETCLQELKEFFYPNFELVKLYPDDKYVLKSLDLALKCEDKDLLGLLSDIIFRSPNCTNDIAKKILEGWGLLLNDMEKVKYYQKLYPKYAVIKVEPPPPPPQRR